MGKGAKLAGRTLLLSLVASFFLVGASVPSARAGGTGHVSVEELGFYHHGRPVISAEEGWNIEVRIRVKNVGGGMWTGGVKVALMGAAACSDHYISWSGALPPGGARTLTHSFVMADGEMNVLSWRHDVSTYAWREEGPGETAVDWALKSDIRLVTPIENEAGVKVVDKRPMETVRGYRAGNADGTYFPGDSFTVRVLAKSDGKRGKCVRDRWKVYDTEGQVEEEKPWYGESKRVEDNRKGDWHDNREEAEEEADEKLDQPDVDTAGVENSCPPLGSCQWRAWWIDESRKVELLKLEPAADVRYVTYNLGTEVENVEISPSVLRLENDESVARRAHIGLGEGVHPGWYRVKVRMTAPDNGHYNPYENVKPIENDIRVRVAKYDPVVRRIPYICPYWGPGLTSWMIQKPNAVVTRYDGSRAQDNQLFPERRTVVSGISIRGSISKPLHADHMFQKWSGENPAYENENAPPNNLAVDGDGHVKLAEGPDGKHYEGGTLISSVLEPPLYENGAQGPPVWEGGGWEADTPSGTHVEVYARFAGSVAELIQTRDWVPVGSLEDGSREGRYGQYRAVLYTEDPSSTPTLERVRLELSNAGQEGNFIWAQKDWTGGPGYLAPKSTSGGDDPRWVQGGYHTHRDPLFYREGDTIMQGSGVPRMGKVKLVPEDPVFGPHTPRSSIRLELEPGELPEDLKGKTSTMEIAPSRSDLHMENVVFRPGHEEVSGEKVFVFAERGTDLLPYPVREEPSFKYCGENLYEGRYKKWRFFFYPRGPVLDFHYPRMFEWFEDATVGMNVTFWFHQEVSRDGFERRTLEPAFTSSLEWAPMADHQPVRVSSWELKGWAEDNLAGNPRVVLQDNAWRVDGRVQFRFRFTSMQSPENFLRRTKRIASFLGKENTLGLEEALKAYSGTLEWMENLGLSVEGVPEIRERDVTSMRETLLSVAAMDNEMLQMVLGDLEGENAGPQLVRGQGSAVDNLEYRIGGYFTVEENAWIPGENRENLLEAVALPFDPSRTVEFNINLSGEGLAAEVARETSAWAKIRIYDPPRSGGLKSVKVYDNEENLLMSENYGITTLGWLPLLGGGEESWPELTFTKWSGSPTELVLEMTNEWGATTTQTVHLSPGRPPIEGIGFRMSWKWVVLGIFAVMAWVAVVRKWREKRGGRRRRERVHPPF